MSKSEIETKCKSVKDFVAIADEKKLYLPETRFLKRRWITMWLRREKHFLSRVN